MIIAVDTEYQDLIWRCVNGGDRISTRNASVHRRTIHYSEFESTPLVGVRKIAWKNALREWQWFMSGSNQIDELAESVRPWWAPWADEDGVVANNYSHQFRKFHGKDRITDQIEYLISGIRDHPYSRRNVITTWNTADMESKDTPITNCHGTVIQAFCTPAEPDGKDGSLPDTLDIFTYQRSVDVICGLPHNWIQYWAFLLWLAHRTGKQPGRLQWMGGDVHVYQAHTQLAQKIISIGHRAISPTPELVYTPTSSEFLANDFSLSGEYQPVLTEKAGMVV